MSDRSLTIFLPTFFLLRPSENIIPGNKKRTFLNDGSRARLGVLPFVFLLLSFFGTACSERPMTAKEEQAIRLVKSYAPSEGYFSVISNIDHQARESGQSGNAWSRRTWEAGLQSQTDRLVETLSQYLNVFEAPGGRWVRLTYATVRGFMKQRGRWIFIANVLCRKTRLPRR